MPARSFFIALCFWLPKVPKVERLLGEVEGYKAEVGSLHMQNEDALLALSKPFGDSWACKTYAAGGSGIKVRLCNKL